MMDFNLATWIIQAHSIYKHEKQQLTQVSAAHNAFESLSRLQQKQMSLKKIKDFLNWIPGQNKENKYLQEACP